MSYLSSPLPLPCHDYCRDDYHDYHNDYHYYRDDYNDYFHYSHDDYYDYHDGCSCSAAPAAVGLQQYSPEKEQGTKKDPSNLVDVILNLRYAWLLLSFIITINNVLSRCQVVR